MSGGTSLANWVACSAALDGAPAVGRSDCRASDVRAAAPDPAVARRCASVASIAGSRTTGDRPRSLRLAGDAPDAAGHRDEPAQPVGRADRCPHAEPMAADPRARRRAPARRRGVLSSARSARSRTPRSTRGQRDRDQQPDEGVRARRAARRLAARPARADRGVLRCIHDLLGNNGVAPGERMQLAALRQSRVFGAAVTPSSIRISIGCAGSSPTSRG